MPVVDGKHYPYTKEGKKRAEEAKKKKKKKKKKSGGSSVDKAFSNKY
jgi:hypothetical protein